MRGTGIAALALTLASVGCARNLAPPREIDLKYEGPIESRDIVEGGRIYTTLCTACHRGRVNPRGYSWSPGQMRHQIREGNRLMPPLSDELLSDEQVEAVLAYLSVMGALDGDLPPTRGGDLDLDEELAEEDLEELEELEEAQRELVGATESPELPARAPTPEPPGTSTAGSEPGPAGTPSDVEAPVDEGAPREGAQGLAPPSGAPTDASTVPAADSDGEAESDDEAPAADEAVADS